jgi:hypothetical protein
MYTIFKVKPYATTLQSLMVHTCNMLTKFNGLVALGTLQKGSIIYLQNELLWLLTNGYNLHLSIILCLEYMLHQMPPTHLLFDDFHFAYRTIIPQHFNIIDSSTTLIGHPFSISFPPTY